MGSYRQTAATDYRCVDGTETITYTSGATGASPVAFPILYADRHAFTRGEIVAGDGLFSFGDEQWGLGCDQFPAGIAPAIGDTILDADGLLWVVIEGSIRDDLGVSWFVPSRRKR